MNRRTGDAMGVLNLPREIEMDILSRLPVDSLMRFRCVSKPSRSLISDPNFVKLHLNRSILSKNCQKISLSSFPFRSIDYESLLDNNNNNNNDINNAVVKLDCPFWSRSRNLVSAIGSCNGLICYLVDGFKVILYNPSTRVYKELPKAPHWSVGYFGFAFDSSDHDYKVLMATTNIIGDTSKNDIRFHMFSLRHNSWRTMHDVSCSYNPKFSGHGCFLNGAFHWLINPRVIVSFDLSKEVFSEMSLDNIIQGQTDLSFHRLGVFEECLYAVGFRRRCSNVSFSLANERSVEVWLMKEYGVKASWTKFITIPCNVGTDLTPLCFLRNGELLLKIDQVEQGFYVNRQTKLGSYNTKENTFMKICNFPYFSEAILYVESLVSPKRIHGNVKQPHSWGKKVVMKMLMWLDVILGKKKQTDCFGHYSYRLIYN